MLLCDVQLDDLVMPVSLHDIRYLGFVDVADLVCAILTSGLTAERKSGWLGKVSDLFLEDSKHLVDSAINLSGRDSMHACSSKASLVEVRQDG